MNGYSVRTDMLRCQDEAGILGVSGEYTRPYIVDTPPGERWGGEAGNIAK